MKLRIDGIRDRGDAAKERVVLKVLSDSDAGAFTVFRTDARDGNATTSVYNTFWFPNKALSTGDLVVLYSKLGTSSEKMNKDNSKSHFFYWGLAGPIWSDKTQAAVLLESPDWQTFPLAD
ncbi:MAG: hypothetical protein HOP28_06310 [Gemmatimonadales bacterium]|nr:hypothetical protein [Gemmatimonadales bacterium]